MKQNMALVVLIALMLTVSALYFVFSSYGEALESGNHNIIEKQNETILSTNIATHTETEQAGVPKDNQSSTSEKGGLDEDVHQASESPKQLLSVSEHIEGSKEVSSSDNLTGEVHNEAGEVHNEAGEVHNEAGENSKRSLETPGLMFAGIAYVISAVMLIIYKPRRIFPYVVIIIGSGILIGMYIISRTTGFPLLGVESVGPLDIFTNTLQVGIIICSLFIIRKNRVVDVGGHSP